MLAESEAERRQAWQQLQNIRAAFPEVLTAIKTKQLAQELLLFKEDHIQDVGRTGMSGRP